MTMFERIQRAFIGDPGEPALMDHVPVHTDADAARTARHREKLELAAKRHGKPFKHAADGLPREVIKNGAPVTVGVKPSPAPEPPPLPNVTTIKRKAK